MKLPKIPTTRLLRSFQIFIFFLVLIGADLIPTPAKADPFACRSQLYASLKQTLQGASLEGLHKNLKFDPIQKLSFEILRRFDPKKYFFVGLGRSPYPITSFIETIVPNSTTTIPLSYNRRIPFIKRMYPYANKKDPHLPYSWGTSYEIQFSKTKKDTTERVWTKHPHLHAQLYAFLDEFYPSPEILQGREIVLLDFSDYGSSLTKFYADMLAYQKEKKRTDGLNLLYLTTREPMPVDADGYWGNGRWFRENLAKQYKIDPNTPYTSIMLEDQFADVAVLFDSQVHKPWAPYGHHMLKDQPLKKKPKLKKRWQFEKFLNALRADFERAMTSDDDFKKRVQEIRKSVGIVESTSN